MPVEAVWVPGTLARGSGWRARLKRRTLAGSSAALLAVSACRPLTHGPKLDGQNAVSRAPSLPSPSASAPSQAPAAPQAKAVSASPEGALPSAAAAPEPFEGTLFPPADVAPPHERSAAPGDGIWQPLGNVGARASRLYQAVLHPHKVSKWEKLTLVVIDQRHVRISYVPGAADLEEIGKLTSREPRIETAPGLVPEAERPRLLAVFNGGFKPRHGRWGMKSGGQTLLEPRPEGCTVAIDSSARVNVWPWALVQERAGQIVHFRQTPPCLLAEGKLHEQLAAFNEKPWGGFDPKRKTRRRSAIGVDASGRYLFYAIAEEMGPLVLAEGLRHAGAEFAAELDINWSWTRFLMFEGEAASPRVTATLLPKMVYQRGEYIEKPAARGFFYVSER